METVKKQKNKKIGKIFTIFTLILTICLTLTMADLFSSLITVGGFTFTNGDISLNKYTLYAISINNSETKIQADEYAGLCKIQGGAGYVYINNSKYHCITSIYENEADANKVLSNLKKENKNPNASIITIQIPTISLSSNLSGEEKTNLEQALNIFKNTYKRLYDLSVSLDTSVISEVNARLTINTLASEITAISTNFTTLFNKQMTNNFLIIKLKLQELSTIIDKLVKQQSSLPFTSEIKNTYTNSIMIYKSLAETLSK